MDLHTWTNLAADRYATGLFAFARFGAVLFSAPLIGGRGVPNRVRIGLAAILAMLMTPLLPPTEVPNVQYAAACVVKELGVGLALGWAASLFYSAAQMAGEWLDLQAGFQMGHLFNPALDAQTAPMGSAKMVVAGMAFVGAGGHVVVLKATAASFAASPAGTLQLAAGLSGDWVAILVRVIWTAVQLAAPVGVVLFLAEVAVGIANRMLPQMSVMILTLPLKAAAAVACLALALPTVARLLATSFTNLGPELHGILRVMGG